MKFVQVYNPREDSPEVLKKLLVGRETILDEILSDLRRQTSRGSRQHWLIRGPRGIGKTHLMGMVYHSALADPNLSASYQPVWLSEKDAYEVYSAGFFLEKIASRLKTELGGPAGEDLQKELDDVHAEGDDPYFFDSVLEILKQTSQRIGKTLLVIAENLDSLLSGFSARNRSAESQRVRSVMQHDHEFLFIGTTPTHYLPGIADPRKPLYGQFRERQLLGLTENETETLFATLADVYGQSEKRNLLSISTQQPNRRRIFHRLTAGNPRSVVMSFHVVAGVESMEGIINDLRSLLDSQTGYFEARLARLAPRERSIVGALSASEENLTAREIARRTRLPERSISTQLGRLVEEGHVAEVEGSGGKGTVYEVPDGLFRLWFQFREGRRLLEPIVRFLSFWHSPQELSDTITVLSSEMANAENLAERERASWTLRHVEEAYRFQTSDSGRIKRQRFFAENQFSIDNSTESKVDQPTELADARALIEQQRHVEAIALLNDIINRMCVQAGSAGEGTNVVISTALLYRGVSLGRVGRVDEGIEDYRELIERFNGQNDPAAQANVTKAMYNLGLALGDTGRFDEAIENYRAVIERFYEREESPLLKQVIGSMVNLGAALLNTGRLDEAIDSCRAVVARYGHMEDPESLGAVARAMVNLGNALGELHRFDESIDTHRAVIVRFGERDDPTSQQAIARAMHNLAETFKKAGRLDEAIETYRAVIERFEGREVSALQEQVSIAMVGLGIALEDAGRLDEAIESYQAVTARFSEQQSPAQLEVVAIGMVNLGIALGDAGRLDEAIESYRSVIDRLGEQQSPALLEAMAKAMVNLGVTLEDTGRENEAIDSYRSVIERFGKQQSPALLEAVAKAMVNLGVTLEEAGRENEAIDSYRSVIERFGSQENPALLELAAKAMVNLGIMRERANRVDEAIDSYRSVISRFGEHENPALLEPIARAMAYLGSTLDTAGRVDEAIETYRAVTARFIDREDPVLLLQVANAMISLGSALERQGSTNDAKEAYEAALARFHDSEYEAILQPMARAYRALITQALADNRARARSLADDWVSSIRRHRDHAVIEVITPMLQFLMRTFDEPEVHQWLSELESLGDKRGVSELARLHRFVLQVLEASLPAKAKRDEGAETRKSLSLRRVPSEVRDTVKEMVEDILRMRRSKRALKPGTAKVKSLHTSKPRGKVSSARIKNRSKN